MANTAPDTDFKRLMAAMATAVDAISEAMAIFLEEHLAKTESQRVAARLKTHFEKAYPRKHYGSTGIDWHIVEGLYKNQRGHTARRQGENPRLVQLVIFHMEEALKQTDERRIAAGHILFPSPLYIAVEALTVPQEPHTRAFPLLAARSLLSRRLGIWPRNAFTDQVDSKDSPIDENVIIEEIGNCRTWVQYGDIWEIKSDPRKSFIGNFLALRGVLLMRFTYGEGIKFLRGGMFSTGWQKSSSRQSQGLQFKLSKKYERLPPPADFMNEILGVPVALRGMDNVFFNGIKPSVNAGLVVQLSGGPGSGKTTFALALAASLAPMGTQTLYFSFEEAEGDLISKLRQQSQPRLSKLSYHQSPDDKWFQAFDIGVTSLDTIEDQVIAPLKARLELSKADSPAVRESGGVLPPLPFLVVLDSLSALSLDENSKKGQTNSIRQRLASFVSLCREMRVLVILITSDDRLAWGDLDYVVDMVINLRVEGAQEHNKKPIRLLSLTKSRQQISRHGTHIFHLSGESGFRIAPQLSSQMDSQQDVRQLLWDRDSFIQALNIRSTGSGGYKYVDFIKLHWRSQILLQGKGSSGKAGLAMRIALSPRFSENGYIEDQSSPKVLVLSFLYPPAYYETLQQRLHRAMQREIKISSLLKFNADQAAKYIKEIPPVEVIRLTPGALHAEDLHSMLVRHLDAGKLNGRPYTAVIIDGLHNLALQFPGASESSYLFPILYGTLSRANVTTITTFTTLSINSSELGPAADTQEESVFRLRVHLPLLHTLVQASDYVLEVVRKDRKLLNKSSILQGSDENSVYLVRVQSAISRDPPDGLIGWHRQELEFADPGWEQQGTQASLPMD